MPSYQQLSSGESLLLVSLLSAPHASAAVYLQPQPGSY